MARVTTVKAARKDQGQCGKCGFEIRKGCAYVHASPGFRAPKKIRCARPECRFRPSDLTTSKLATIYAAQEAAEDSIADLDADSTDKGTFDSILEAVAEAADEVAQEYRDASQEWGAYGHEEWDENADRCEEYAEALREVANGIEEPPSEEEDEEEREDEDYEPNARVLWFDEAKDAVETVIGDFDL